ncbi:MAG: helix-turn-helix domain containing protein [Alphaproteobacteria bacterium]|nr:helix-turn-helix domain containing protein [Alphaproteobacteria bacterium]MBU0875580.1 helix-turn-helix domain containing protein [Alphaproteobacteria bacterium]MBU1770796.1 helix-turn-helix domain containing protein [Alphaproteobacteria bacterium]
MAKALGIDHQTYAKYEFRSPLPQKHVEQFCLIAGVSIEWLFTGEERKRA